MKFTSEDLINAKKSLAEIIRYNLEEIYDNGGEIGYENPLQDECHSISKALEELERLLPKPKKVGDLKCGGLECQECPLRTIRCDKDDVDIEDCSLYYILESVLVGTEFDQEIYHLLKKRLDKEVVEEND